jgi:uncharacterized protein with von Willebrand factor type A (vWA) domain
VPDLAALAARLTDALHRAGLPVGPERAARFARAVGLVAPAGRDRLYWTARAVFVGSVTEVPVFDRVWAALLDTPLGDLPDRPVDPADRRGDPAAPPPVRADPALAARPTAGRPRADTADRADRDVPLALASAEERLATTAFDRLDPDELAAVARLIRRFALTPPLRRSRRSRSAVHGERVDVRATLRRSHRTGGDPVRLRRRSRVERRRRLVLLCDVSGSMQPYTRAYLQLLHTAVGGAGAEAFVFATRLTRLTPQLRRRDPDAALDRAAAAAPDWSGGTRLAGALRAFLDGYGRRGLARGAVVVVVSDGMSLDDPADVAEQMARLRRLAHRVVWVNPRKAAPGFVPLVGGMAAALPACDAFVSGHSVCALAEVAAVVGGRG